MDSLRDLIEEAKLRTVWWILCIFALTYFLTNTSKSMLTNAPIAVLLVCGLRMLFNELEFRRKKVRGARPTSYLSHLEKKQVSVDDSPPQKWKRRIDSPVVEAAAEDFIGKVLKDFVVDLWYSDITPDKEAPQLMHGIIMDVLGEVSGRLKELNLVELLTRDLVDLVGRHLDLFRRNQAAIGVDVMKTLSSEERDERLKHHLLASKELHPALICPESEYKVLKRLMGGVLAVVLRPREVQSPLVRCIARELLTCLVMQPIMNFASPGYINELIEFIILAHNEGFKDVADQSPNVEGLKCDGTVSAESGRSTKSNFEEKTSSNNQGTNSSSFQSEYKRKLESGASGNQLSSTMQYESINQRHANWTKVLEAATQRREEVLMPENLENMWTIGRNYKNKLQKRSAPGPPASEITDSVRFALPRKSLVIEAPSFKPRSSIGPEDKASMQLPPRQQRDTRITNLRNDAISSSQDNNKELFSKGGSTSYEMENTATVGSLENRNKLKRSNSSSDFKSQSNPDGMFTHSGTAPIINEYYSADINKFNAHNLKSSSDIVVRTEQLHFPPKLRCRVTGAYFEKLGAKSFAVYLIAVTDTDNNTWFVKRRYRNFERLHKYLKEIPNYTLHLPPKRIFSSSTEDTFVHQRCLRLDKYLQDLLSVANVAEQHEVWDFLSDSSKNYSFGKSPTVMRTLAVNVDDAMDDIVRQFKETSGGPAPSVIGTPSSSYHEPASSTADRNLTWDFEDKSRLIMRQSASESIDSYSDSEEVDKEANHAPEDVSSAAQASGWKLDNELESRRFPPRADNLGEVAGNLNIEEIHSSRMKPESNCRYPDASLALTSVSREDPTGVPPEWTPPNLSVPVLNLVDNIFQLKSRGWLRRQVFWISKQILQLVMEDAIDDWLLRQIQWLHREDVIAQGIHWVKDVLWPNGTFFLRLGIQDQPDNDQADQTSQETTYQSDGRKVAQSGSFEQQLEATRRASIVKKMIFDGAPTTLVSLIGHKQYKRCARDIYYFLQSSVCLKQLGYGMLELVLISVFPELRDLVTDVHHEMHNQTV